MGDTTSMSDERILAQEEQGLIDPRPEGEVETERTRRNIRNTLKYQLHKEYGIPVKDTGDLADRILKVHGLSKDDFDVVHKMHSLMTNRLNDESIDPNANKDSKTILGIQTEASNPSAKAIGYDFLYCQMLKDWGKKEAKELSGLMYDYSIPIHDSTKLLVPYCFCFDASKIVFEGRPFGQVKSRPPKRVSSYIASLDETIHQMTNHLAGAIAIGTFFSDIAYILINREHVDLNSLKTDLSIRKYVENCMQTFIYSVNHLSRASNESPFTNVSVFDRPKLRAVFNEDNMGWMFHTEEGEIDPEYFYDMIDELQNIFLDYFDKGDPLAGGRPYRFPVLTINISKTSNGEIDPGSEDFLKAISKRDIYRYNIFTSEGTKVASCCFDYNTEIHFYDKNQNVYHMSIGDFVESRLKDTELGGRDYIQTIFKPEEAEDFIAIPGGKLAPITGVIKLANKHRKLISITFTSGDNIKVTPEQQMMCQNGEMIRARDLVEGSYLYNDLVVASVEEIKSDAPVYDIEVGTEDHLFKIKMEKSGHNLRVANCRLLSDLELNELGAQSNSFGGSAISVGSHRVALLNTNRYALELQGKGDADDFFRLLSERLEQATKILVSHRHLIQMTQKMGLQMFLDLGWIQLEKMFSTIGLIGLTETVNTLNEGLDKANGDKLLDMKEMMHFINKRVNELSAKYGVPMNIEQVPGESMAPRLAKVDKMLFGEDKVPYELYSNQFVPLWEDATIFERMERDGELNHCFTGGGIVHFNLGEKTTPQQNYELIKYAIKCGCEHYSLNSIFSLCPNDHSSFGKLDKCPVCGEPITDYMTRVVGFFVKVSAFNPTRREWEFPRRRFREIPSVDKIKTEEKKFG